ncbi:MAG: NAD(P)-dependent oxidoreductase, partial [Myxococcales bacterium]|nr:NAD(P)-dependent oxidoreductase [Myxococcales bacterium]
MATSSQSGPPRSPGHVLITGGAGYVGSLLTGLLLERGWRVTVADSLLFGGESLLGYWHHPRFRFVKADVCEPGAIAPLLEPWDGERQLVVHLAAIVGFPACQSVGEAVARRFNVESTRLVLEQAEEAGVERLVFSSTYSNYGRSPDGRPVTEDSALHPQSLYAETKIAAEQLLLDAAKDAAAAPIVLRFATLFGISPRTRFDLIVNQFVLEALTRRKLVIYQRGYARAFVHIRDVGEAIATVLDVPVKTVRGQVFNVGSDAGNHTKDEIVRLVQKHVRNVDVEY